MSNRRDILPAGTIVTAGEIRSWSFSPDFPGYGEGVEASDYFVTVTPGQLGKITRIESHGINPWTRYSIEWTNGCRSHGIDPKSVTRT